MRLDSIFSKTSFSKIKNVKVTSELAQTLFGNKGTDSKSESDFVSRDREKNNAIAQKSGVGELCRLLLLKSLLSNQTESSFHFQYLYLENVLHSMKYVCLCLRRFLLPTFPCFVLTPSLIIIVIITQGPHAPDELK